MPWDVKKDDRCPADHPWAVVQQGTGDLEGCHTSKDMAQEQQKALYANEPRSEETGDRTLAKSEREFRVSTDVWPDVDQEIRALDEGRKFEGLPIIFNSLSEPIQERGRLFRERVMPDSVTRTLGQNRNIKMFLNHNTDLLLASTRAETLRLQADGVGVRSNADLPDTTAGRDASELLQRRDIDSMSFGFRVVKDNWIAAGKDDDLPVRELHDIELFEVSPVTGWPAYSATSAFVRHLAELTDLAPEPLADALRLLVDPGGKLTPEQRDLLLATINVRTDVPLVGPLLNRWQNRLAELPVS